MATEPVREQPTAEVEHFTEPYSPSWLDRLITWIEHLPGPVWLFYAALPLGFTLLFHLLSWQSGILAPGKLDLELINATLIPIYFLALMHYLNSVARRALEAFRPALEINQAEYERLRFELTTVPAKVGRAGIGVGIVLTILQVLADPAGYHLSDPKAIYIPIFLIIVTAFLLTTLVMYIYRTIRQLGLVNQLHRQATRINLFQLAPVHAFSALTARTGTGLILFSVYLVVVNTAAGIDLASLGLVVVIGLLGVVCFILPLNGMHGRLVAEKGYLMAEVNQRLEEMVSKLYRRVDADNLERMDDLNKAIASLAQVRDVQARFSTWPWEPGTLRGFLSALILPIMLWLIITILGQIIGF